MTGKVNASGGMSWLKAEPVGEGEEYRAQSGADGHHVLVVDRRGSHRARKGLFSVLGGVPCATSTSGHDDGDPAFSSPASGGGGTSGSSRPINSGIFMVATRQIRSCLISP